MEIARRSKPLTVGISLGGVNLREVNLLKYLGSLTDEDPRSDCDIRARIGMAKATHGQLRKILVNFNMGRATRLRVLKAYVGSILLFGCEA